MMPANNYENPNSFEDSLTELAKILSTLQLNDDELSASLKELKMELENNQNKLDTENYFKNKNVQAALQKIAPHNTYFFLNALHLCWQEPHRFSIYEKIALRMSFGVLILCAALLPENLILFFNARVALAKTGNGIADFCSPTAPGSQSRVAEICASISNDTKAVFDISAPDNLPVYILPTNSSAVILNHEAHSLFNPLQWMNYVTCQNADFFKIVCHSLSGSPAEFAKKAPDGAFPVITMTDKIDPFFANTTIQIIISLAFASFCIVMKEGGRGELGHTDGFERPAKDFGVYARIFGSVYGVVAAAAALITLVLQCKKMMSKWNDSSDKRRAAALFKICETHVQQQPNNSVNMHI